MVKKKKAKNKDHIARTLKILKEQYDSGDLTKEEYSKAKKIVKEDKPESFIDGILDAQWFGILMFFLIAFTLYIFFG